MTCAIGLVGLCGGEGIGDGGKCGAMGTSTCGIDVVSSHIV